MKEKTILRERTRLFNFIKTKVNSVEDAEDILQDVFFQFVDGYGVVGSIEKATSWLFTVARNKIIDRYRKNATRNKKLGSPLNVFGEGEDQLMLIDILPDLGNTPEDRYFNSIIKDAITDAIGLLPSEQREVFVMHELEDKSFKEISVITGKSVNTLISRKRYAVLALRKRLEKIYDEL